MSNRTGRLLFGLLLVLAGCGLSAVVVYRPFGGPAGPVQVADQFVELLASGKAHDAHREGSSALRAHRTPAMLTLEAQRWGLKDFAASSWEEVQIEDERATLEGAVTTRGGALVPLVVKLVQEGGEWRVASVTSPEPEKDGE